MPFYSIMLDPTNYLLLKHHSKIFQQRPKKASKIVPVWYLFTTQHWKSTHLIFCSRACTSCVQRSTWTDAEQHQLPTRMRRSDALYVDKEVPIADCNSQNRHKIGRKLKGELIKFVAMKASNKYPGGQSVIKYQWYKYSVIWHVWCLRISLLVSGSLNRHGIIVASWISFTNSTTVPMPSHAPPAITGIGSNVRPTTHGNMLAAAIRPHN